MIPDLPISTEMVSLVCSITRSGLKMSPLLATGPRGPEYARSCLEATRSMTKDFSPNYRSTKEQRLPTEVFAAVYPHGGIGDCPPSTEVYAECPPSTEVYDDCPPSTEVYADCPPRRL